MVRADGGKLEGVEIGLDRVVPDPENPVQTKRMGGVGTVNAEGVVDSRFAAPRGTIAIAGGGWRAANPIRRITLRES